MAQDKDSTKQEGASSTPAKPARKEVDLFPALLTERKTLPSVLPRPERGRDAGTRISMFTPANFEEALDIVECLRTRAATTICLEKMRKLDAGRLVDFVAGASAAIDGNFHKLSEQVYLFCPSNIRIVAPADNLPSREKEGPLDFLYSGRLPQEGTTFNGLWTKS